MTDKKNTILNVKPIKDVLLKVIADLNKRRKRYYSSQERNKKYAS